MEATGTHWPPHITSTLFSLAYHTLKVKSNVQNCLIYVLQLMRQKMYNDFNCCLQNWLTASIINKSIFMDCSQQDASVEWKISTNAQNTHKTSHNLPWLVFPQNCKTAKLQHCSLTLSEALCVCTLGLGLNLGGREKTTGNSHCYKATTTTIVFWYKSLPIKYRKL